MYLEVSHQISLILSKYLTYSYSIEQSLPQRIHKNNKLSLHQSHPGSLANSLT